jgi:hypothetical protein
VATWSSPPTSVATASSSADRAPAARIPHVAVLGTRHFDGGRDFAAVVGRRPAVRVELGQEAPYAQLLVSVDDAEGTVAAIRGATGL